MAQSHAGASRKAALENHVGQFTQIHHSQRMKSSGLSSFRVLSTGCDVPAVPGQDEITVATCASPALPRPTKLCPLHYSELHTFCSCLIDQVTLWTVKKLQIMDLQFSALQLTRTRNNCWHVHNFILRTRQSQWQKQNHYFNSVSFPLGTDLHTVRSKSVLKQDLGGKHSKP